jgi:hypothetical protein
MNNIYYKYLIAHPENREKRRSKKTENLKGDEAPQISQTTPNLCCY